MRSRGQGVLHRDLHVSWEPWRLIGSTTTYETLNRLLDILIVLFGLVVLPFLIATVDAYNHQNNRQNKSDSVEGKVHWVEIARRL